MKRFFPVLKTERLTLRELLPGDLEILYKNWSDPLTMEHLSVGLLSRERSAEMLKLLSRLWEYDQGIRWGIDYEATLIGTCGFHNLRPESGRAEIGYELHRAYWRRGFMKEAAGAILGFGFKNLNFMRIEALTNIDNHPSISFLTHMGFTEEGLLRDYENTPSGLIAQRIFSLLRREWEKTKGINNPISSIFPG